jgi:hypothetical protein
MQIIEQRNADIDVLAASAAFERIWPCTNITEFAGNDRCTRER